MPPSPGNNDELLAAWCDYMHYNKGRTQGTINKYRGYLQRLAKHYAGRSLLELDEMEVQLFAGGVTAKAGLSGRSRRALVSAIRMFYRWAAHNGHMAKNPASALEYPGVPRSLPIPITPENAERLIWAPDISTFKGLRDVTLFAVLCGCGPRVSGLVHLNQEDLVRSGKNEDQRLLLRLREKGDRERLVPVPRDAELLLTAYLGHPELEEIDRRTETGRVLFVSVNNRRIPPQDYKGEHRRLTARGIQYLIRYYGRKQGIPEDQLRPHAMRHLYGAELAESDVDLITSQTLLGHADARSTEIYSHIAVRKLIRTCDLANPLSRMRTPATDILEALCGPSGPGDT